MWLQACWPIPEGQSFVFSVLSQHFPALLSWRVLVRCFGKIIELFQAGAFLLRLYLIPELSCAHLLTDQERREMWECMCKAQPQEMPGSTSAAEIHVSNKSVHPGFV